MSEQPDLHPTLPDPTFQDKDISIGVISICLAVTALVILASFLGMKALYNSYETKYAKENPPAVVTSERTLPPSPRLQVNESADLAEYIAQEQAVLNAPRSVDPATGRGRVPLSEAKQLVLKQGLGPVIQGDAK